MLISNFKKTCRKHHFDVKSFYFQVILKISFKALFYQNASPTPPPEELPYEDYTGVCQFWVNYFQGKISKSVRQFFRRVLKGLQRLEEIPDRVSYFVDTNDKPKEDRTD